MQFHFITAFFSVLISISSGIPNHNASIQVLRASKTWHIVLGFTKRTLCSRIKDPTKPSNWIGKILVFMVGAYIVLMKRFVSFLVMCSKASNSHRRLRPEPWAIITWILNNESNRVSRDVFLLPVKYLGLLAMSRILKTHPKSVQSHKDLVLLCLDDKDESIRLRALDLLYGMVGSDLNVSPASVSIGLCYNVVVVCGRCRRRTWWRSSRSCWCTWTERKGRSIATNSSRKSSRSAVKATTSSSPTLSGKSKLAFHPVCCYNDVQNDDYVTGTWVCWWSWRAWTERSTGSWLPTKCWMSRFACKQFEPSQCHKWFVQHVTSFYVNYTRQSTVIYCAIVGGCAGERPRYCRQLATKRYLWGAIRSCLDLWRIFTVSCTSFTMFIREIHYLILLLWLKYKRCQ